MCERLQAKVDAFVLKHCHQYDKEQLIGLSMLHFVIFYDDAKNLVAQAFQNLNK